MADINQVWKPIWGKIEFTNACTESEQKAENDFKQGKNINIESFDDTEGFENTLVIGQEALSEKTNKELQKYSQLYLNAVENVTDDNLKNENINISKSIASLYKELFEITKDNERYKVGELLNNLNSLTIQKFINSNFREHKSPYIDSVKNKLMAIAATNKIDLNERNIQGFAKSYSK